MCNVEELLIVEGFFVYLNNVFLEFSFDKGPVPLHWQTQRRYDT